MERCQATVMFEFNWLDVRQNTEVFEIKRRPFYVELYKFILSFWNKQHVKLKSVLDFWSLE